MPPPASDILTISALTTRIKELVEEAFPQLWVSGEISNFTKASSGHMYFNLKDAGATIACTFFRGSNLRLKFSPRDGMEVLARGRLSVYPPRGNYQFQVEELQPKGIGAADLALRQLKENLLKKGYFDPKRKRALPRYPKRIALIASVTGAAIRDMIELFAQRWPLAHIVVRHSRVQGDGAADEIANGIRMLNQMHRIGGLPLDAIVIGRGGGSSEDLWSFNEEVLAIAIFQSVVPVVSAVGHETDVTIADLVADHRAETPSAAVVALSPDRREMLAGILNLNERYREAMMRKIDDGRQRLRQISARPAFRKPLQRIRDVEQKLDDWAARLQRAATRRCDRTRDKIAAAAEQLETLSPLNVLKRGYSLTLTPDGEQVIRDASTLKPGEQFIVQLNRGRLIGRVESVELPPTQEN